MSAAVFALNYFLEPKELMSLVSPYVNLEMIDDVELPISITPIESILLVLFLAYGVQTLGIICRVFAGRLNNADTRLFMAKTNKKEEGFFGKLARYAQSAHQNAQEGFPIYATGIILCVQTGVEGADLDRYIKIYLFTRFAYSAVYLLQAIPFLSQPLSILRSSFWAINTMIAALLIKLAATKAAAVPESS
mmetsp:Transcript_18309/g.44944  ORF Transcript_18309/g.44944 Transcript_18309/m.44944 type:complete len:191 (-) Transcript_18309:275-847(-)|eukprot:CAMPEP_0114516894 /NCGR_PEP_ID=MMETSP0109-20121206/17586_1 /TAXON_ID=29199 /ORGANISM="Chlorarachnion reptans, Strain CCCM449" /LENGTH=190 /DNA_ID=CAMNT_0001697343 /DNA_START=63 /DNA_END=635 /DNA_ORIENTATION=+